MSCSSLPAGPDLRIVMIGKTGVGKSAVGNTILGTKVFTSCPSANSVTASCQKGAILWNDRVISVVDTPGILDTKKTPEYIKSEIVRCVQVSCPGPHVFLLVMQASRFTTEEKNCVEALQKLFGPRASQFMIVLFTRGDDLRNVSIQEYVREASPALRAVIHQCGNRFHAFDNTSDDRGQVVELIRKIDLMFVGNQRNYYSDDMYEEAERRLCQQREERALAERREYQFYFLAALLQRIILFQRLLGRE